MNGDVHQRARELALAACVEGIGEQDRRWLEAHVGDCAACADAVASVESAIAGLRGPAAMADARLVRATQTRVRLRAAELQRHRAAMRPLGIVIAIVALYGLLSTAAAWEMFAVAGQWLRLTGTASGMAFAFFWVAPVLAASFLLLACGSHRARWSALALSQDLER